MGRRILLLALLLLGAVVPSAAGTVSPSPRIIGGTAADPAAWGFAAALETDFGRQFCGGALIAADWVLSAGHCRIYAPGSVRVVTGSADLRAPTVQLSRVAQMVRHPDWRMKVEGAPRDDLMLIRLATPSTAPIVPLAPGAAPAAGTLLRVAGWGSTSYNRANDSFGPDTPVLRTVRVKVRSAASCVEAYGSGVFWPSEMLCASLPGQDACAGDSGGPLVQGEGPETALVGVVSWGTGCALARYPGVYSTIAANRCWITSTIGPPAPPTAISLAQEDGALTVEWAWDKPCVEAPNLSGFRLRVAETGQVLEVPAGDRRATIGGLANGVPLTIAVSAVNRNGESGPISAVGAPAPAQASLDSAAWTGYRTARADVTLAPHATPLRWRVETGTALAFRPGPWQDAAPSDVPVRTRVDVDQLPTGVAPDIRVVVESGTTSRSVELEDPIAPQPIRAPVVRGNASVGGTLTCDLGRWTGTRPFEVARAWLLDGRPISGATARALRVRVVDADGLIACRIRVSAPGGITTVRTAPVRIAG